MITIAEIDRIKELPVTTGVFAGKQIKDLPIVYLSFYEIRMKGTEYSGDLRTINGLVQHVSERIGPDNLLPLFETNLLMTVGQFLSWRPKDEQKTIR